MTPEETKHNHTHPVSPTAPLIKPVTPEHKKEAAPEEKK